MKLYYAPGACSLAAHIVANEGGLALELERVDLKAHRTESGADFYAINPKGYVPALRLEDGWLLTENIAVLTFLGEKTGTAGVARDHYRLLEWLGFISSELHKSFSPFFRSPSPDAVKQAVEKITTRLRFVEEGLGSDYLFGMEFSPADAYLYVMLRWAERFEIDLHPFPRLLAFKLRMEKRPAVLSALKAENLA
jgi:glutathione S-transferase